MKLLRTGFCLSATMLASVLSGAYAPASAQDVSTTPSTASTPNTAGPGAKPPPTGSVPASTTQPTTGQAVVAAPGPFDAITNYGQVLKNNGIYLQLGYVQNFLSNVNGGNQLGTSTTGELFFGTVLDLQKILGIPEASFHVTFDQRNGLPANNIVGTQGPLQANSGPTTSFRLSELYWEQGFLNDKIDVTLGRTNPTLDFAVSDVSCEFVSSIICAQPGSWYFSNSNDAYPVSTWGSRINIAPIPNVYFRIGAYENDPSQFNPVGNGFNYWAAQHSTGAFVPAELGYATTFSDSRYPSKYDVGGYYDTSDYAQPGGGVKNGRTAIYAQAQQTVWRPDPASRQSITLFGGGIIYNGGAPYWGQYYAGLFDRSPFASRPLDTVSFIGSYYRQNEAYLPNKNAQWIFELNYGFKIVPGLTLRPVTQYVIAPNEIGFPTTKRPADAWLVGAQVELDVASLLKFPQFVAY